MDNGDVTNKVGSNANRRRFRFGLKGNVDFLIQMDLDNLISTLADKSSDSDDDNIAERTEGHFSI